MHYCKMFGLYVESDIQLHHTREVAVQPVKDVIVRQSIVENEATLQIATGQFSFVIWGDHLSMYLRHDRVGLFQVTNGDSIRYQLEEDADLRYVARVIMTTVMMILLKQRNINIIHGSAVVNNKKAIILSGDSGAGKSTLTNEFVSGGHPYLADDMAAVNATNDGVYVEPSYPRRKLDYSTLAHLGKDPSKYEILSNKYKTKYVVDDIGEFCYEPKELGGILLLKKGKVDAINLSQVTGSHKIKLIHEALYSRSYYIDLPMSAKESIAVMNIAKNAKVFLMTRPEEGMTVREQYRLLKDIEW